MGAVTGIRVRAPQLQGSDWINVDHPLTLAELRGKIVVLDFWTFCCINCLHVIEELRALEARFADEVVVIGVHSPKFAHEADPVAVAAAVERYEIHHPVVNDPALGTWRQYAVRAWPTLVVVDPEGYVVAEAAGEGQVSALSMVIADLVVEHEARGTLRRGSAPYVAPIPEPSTLRFPAKAVLLPAARTGRSRDSLLVADAGHHSVVELDADASTVLRRVGGERGRADGARPRFAEPGGVALLPAELADELGYDVLVADTANHLVRGLRLSDGAVTTVADLTAVELHTITGRVPPVMSPWDVAWWPERRCAVVAAAGVHLLLGVDPRSGAVEILAGTTVEGLKDGPALDGWLAQPSGLAVNGDRVWFADAETSALRWLTLAGEVHTAVGEGLFDFGHVDGPAAQARLQHPLGVALLADGSVAVADTYNGALRRFDPVAAEVTTLAGELAEPSGIVVTDDHVLVVESAAHRITAVATTGALAVSGPALSTSRPAAELAPGAVALRVTFTPPPGRTIDDRFGPSTHLSVSASPPELLLEGAGDGTELERRLRVAPIDGVLHITAQAASCDDGATDNPACYLSRQDWGVPIVSAPAGASELTLMLLG